MQLTLQLHLMIQIQSHIQGKFNSYKLFRRRINEVFEDGDKAVLLLKDKGKIFKNHLEEDWYEQAFGKKRN